MELNRNGCTATAGLANSGRKCMSSAWIRHAFRDTGQGRITPLTSSFGLLRSLFRNQLALRSVVHHQSESLTPFS
jgi:hypothetical protein